MFLNFIKLNKQIFLVGSATGVLGKDTFITTLVAKTILDAQEHLWKDVSVVPVPWNESRFSEKKTLTIGYFDNFEYFPCTPGVKRAVHEAIKHLKVAGHTLLPFSMLNPEMIIEEFFKLTTADDGKIRRLDLEGDIHDPCLGLEHLDPKDFHFQSPIMAPMIRSKY